MWRTKSSQSQLPFSPHHLFSQQPQLQSRLVDILHSISTNQYTVKDSFSFAHWAKQCRHHNGLMCSLDICHVTLYLRSMHSQKLPNTNLTQQGTVFLVHRTYHALACESLAAKNTLLSMAGTAIRLMVWPCLGSPLGPVLATILV